MNETKSSGEGMAWDSPSLSIYPEPISPQTTHARCHSDPILLVSRAIRGSSVTRQVKDEAPPKQKSTQTTEGSTTKGPTQKATYRVHGRTPTGDIEGGTLPNSELKPLKTVKECPGLRTTMGRKR